MLNCVNALEHIPATEQAGLVVTEEKAHQDSCKYFNAAIFELL